MPYQFNPLTGNLDYYSASGGGGTTDTLLRGKYVYSTRFYSVASGTTGALGVSQPANSTIVLDDFSGGADALTAQIAAGIVVAQSAKTASGAPISVTLDSGGNYVLSATPSSYPIAIVYRVRQLASQFDSTSADIIGIPYFVDVTDDSLILRDVTTNDASTTKHGFLKKLSNVASEFMNGAGNWVAVTKANVGLGSADDTSDANKPVSTAQQTALDLKAAKVDIQTFTSSGTWTKPSGAKCVEVHLLGAGGGAGSGCVGADGAIRCGGGGGSAGVYANAKFSAAQLGVTETVTVGAKGTGGAAKVGAGVGNNGTAGGDTTLGSWLKALGGALGSGGTAAASNGGTAIVTTAGPNVYPQRGGANGSATGGQASAAPVSDLPPTGGGAGGGLPSTGALRAGSSGGSISGNLSTLLNLAGGTTPPGATTNAGNGQSADWLFGLGIGTGGGGSTSNLSGASGNGGNGGNYGAGGGASGAATTQSGTAGDGSDGAVVIVTWF